MKSQLYFLLVVVILLFACEKEKPETVEDPCKTQNNVSVISARNFEMGFTTWPFGPNTVDVEGTFQFIKDNGDIYAEHLDNRIPWSAWMTDQQLPQEFVDEIAGKASKKINGHKLLLSVSPLNSNRSEFWEDFDGNIPVYDSMSDTKIADAYFKHIEYMVERLSPDYLVIAIEVNELRLRAPDKWEGYKAFIQNVKSRIKAAYPDLKISESFSLHNLYHGGTADSTAYIDEMVDYMNQMDFAAISYYPFMGGQRTPAQIQEVFDFLNNRITTPIAFAETGHIAENLSVTNLNVNIAGDVCEQNAYLEILVTNAYQNDYEFMIWWTHRDFDALWEVFPDEVKDVGKLWRDTGILAENGDERPAYFTWTSVLAK